MSYQLLLTPEFQSWFEKLDPKTQLIITSRLERLQIEGHWGFVNRFDNLIELKWTSGIRVYTSLKQNNILVLLGGNKNGQSKDIKKAQKLLAKYIEEV
ncbi:hypothetical protein [Bdellovibrio sp. BCCA]|uniref:hypothetical protein n=1 Tax=Bdellovibrio sp. BCCA TaxID=3136281 RepID=UPI0030F00DDD